MSKLGSLNTSLEQLQQLLSQFETTSTTTFSTFDSLDECVEQLTTLTEPLRQKARQLTLAQNNIKVVEQDTEELIKQLDVSRQVQDLLQLGAKNRDWGVFLSKVEELGQCIGSLQTRQKLSSARDAVGHGKQVLQDVNKDLDQQLVAQSKSFVAELSIDQIQQFAFHPPSQGDEEGMRHMIRGKVTLLSQRLMQVMLKGGYNECLATYSNCRILKVQQAMEKVGVQLPGQISLQQMAPKDQVQKMHGWIELMNVWSSMMLLEWLVCEQSVPKDIVPTVLSPVQTVTLEPLWQFIQDLWYGTKDVEIIFPMVQMHQVLVHVQANLHQVFSVQQLQKTEESLQRMYQDIESFCKQIFNGFQKDVAEDHSSVDIEPGTVHPRTAYVVRIIKRLFRDKDVETVLFQQLETGGSISSQLSSSSMRKPLLQIIDFQISNLKQKASSLYTKDQPLQSLFMMNNLHFIVTGIENTQELMTLIGTEWLQKHSTVVEEYANQFVKKSWEELGNKTDVEGMEDVVGGDHLAKKERQRVKDAFKQFNTSLSLLHKQQVDWCIPDVELREVMIQMVVDEVVPSYKDLLDQFKDVDFTRNLDKYVVYTPHQVEEMLRGLFSKNTTFLTAVSYRGSKHIDS